MQMDGNFVQKRGGIENVVREAEFLDITSGNHMELPSQDSAGNNNRTAQKKKFIKCFQFCKNVYFCRVFKKVVHTLTKGPLKEYRSEPSCSKGG